MDAQKLIDGSPLRKLDERLGGGLDRGQLGIVIARHGAGKTPFVVGMALDELLRGERVLHISLEAKADHVREFYEQILVEMLASAGVEAGPGEMLEIERARRIHTYLDGNFSTEKLATAMTFMREHATFEPALVIVDGYDFEAAGRDGLAALIEVVRAGRASLWMTAVRHRDQEVSDPDGVPSPVAAVKELATAILDLHTVDSVVKATVLRPEAARGELPFVLEPTTMRIK